MNIERFDLWLKPDGPVALVVREELAPVQGKGSVFFPPTFAPPEGSKENPGYVVDETADGKVALIDSVGAQSNRMEPLFKTEPYTKLVPKAVVRIGDREVNLLDVGHRAADAVVRFSDRWNDLRNAFIAVKDRRDVTTLAKLSPTSLIFGVWDSRDTQVKLPRIVGSTIRAYQVERLSRSAQFFAAAEKDEIEDLGSKDFLSAVGLTDAPAGRTHGGVIAHGDIRREAILNLVALRALTASDAQQTTVLQRYLLGLALVAVLAPSNGFLREGCLLVPASEDGPQQELVQRNGKREPMKISHDDVTEFASAAADAFGVGPGWTAIFQKENVTKAKTKKDTETKKSQ